MSLLFCIPSTGYAFSWQEQIGRLSLRNDVDPDLATAIIGCESGFRPFAINRNRNGSYDYSLFQVNDGWYGFFLRRGLDITDPIDNLEAGFYLLRTRGTRDWNASRHCWEPKMTYITMR